MATHLTRNYQENYVMARIMRARVMHHQNFTLREFGSWEEAESAGKKWVAERIKDLPPQIPVKNRMTKRNTSGKVGVHLSVTNPKKKPGQDYYRWIARWPGCPMSGGLGWSVNQFDDDGAFVLAAIARDMESVDREEILSYFEVILGTPDYDAITKLREKNEKS